MIRAFIMLMLWSVATTAFAANEHCGAGQLYQDGACVNCKPSHEPYYCPDENTRMECPAHPANAMEYYTNMTGATVVANATYRWSLSNATKPSDCSGDIIFETSEGNRFMAECAWDGTDYVGGCKGVYLWYLAANGYYLSPYLRSTNQDFYSGAKQCSNAPLHAHYTGPGTPDDPVKGGKTDYNDCPWECDCGYVKNNDTCVAAAECGAGIKTLKTNTGLSYKLYSTQTTKPTLAIGHNGNTCYGCLESGAADGAINVSFDGATYHTVD